MTVLAAVCTKIPEAKLAIIFLPMFTFTAGNVSGFEKWKESIHSLLPVSYLSTFLLVLTFQNSP